MKKIMNIQWVFGFILVLISMSSCEDELDVVPSDKIGIERILNKNTIINFRTNSYDHLNKTFGGDYSNQLLDAYTDDAFRSGLGGTYNWHNGQLMPSGTLFANGLWKSYWQGIRKCNLALKYLPQSEVSADLISDEDLNQWFDEVQLLRAWYHFMLVKNFGPIPFAEEAFHPDFTGWSELKRPTYDEIAARIVSEIDAVIAKNRLPLRWGTSSDYDKANMAMAYALKSKVLLYSASLLNNPSNSSSKWQEAADAATEALNKLVPEYGLLPIEDYGRLFGEAIDVYNDEVILRSKANDAGFMNNNNGVDLAFLGSAKQSNNCGSVPSQELVDCFEMLDGSLPVVSYNNASHTDVTYGAGYSENPGDDPYAGRDARLAHAIVYNGAGYGKYKGMPATAPDLTIYTYEGKLGTGFNENPTSEEDADKRRSSTGYYGKKFRAATHWGSTAGGANAHKIYFRLAEVYLNLAEAQCELNNLDAAIDALDVVRTRAGQPGIANVPGFVKTKEFLIKRIRNDRRVELCFEDHRFYDQRRWKILSETNNVVTGMKIVSDDNTDNGTFSYQRVKIDVPRLATTDKYLVLPLSTEEARKLTGIGQPDAWK